MEKNKAVMAGALVLAGAAFWAGLLTGERSVNGGGETATVLVARADLPAGAVLSEDLVETLKLPRRYMQADSYEVRSMSDVKLVNGLTARVRIPKGNQVTLSCLAAGAPAADASLPPSQRHYSRE
jgi:Flp pilus assembly protein CpaB